MTSFLKKFQILKKKEMESSSSLAPANRGQWDSREGHFSGFQPPSVQDPANQRTSQLLPLLVKPSTSPAAADAKKKAQTQPLVLPELVQRPTNQKAPPATNKVDDKYGRHPAVEISLPKLFSKEKPKKLSTPVKKKPPEPLVPIYPELSDEQFKFLWDPRKLHRGRSIRESVDMMDEREILDTILIYLNHSVQRPSGVDPRQNRRKSEEIGSSQKTLVQQKSKQSSQEKILLYKYFGVKLRDSRNKDVVSEYLHILLGFAVQDEEEREGVSEAIRIIAFCHLSEILCALRDFGHLMPLRKTLQREPTAEEIKNISERHICTTLILCYGQAAMGAKPEDMLALVDFMVAEILYHYRGNNKDEIMKKTFMRAVIMISKALQLTKKFDIHFPHKSELVVCIIEVLEEEPQVSFSVPIIHQAMVTVTCMTPLKPPLDSEVRSELVNKSVKKVFSLPSVQVSKLRAVNPIHLIQSQEFYQQTINACQNMLIGLLNEVPSLESLQDILIHINSWIESPKICERERAVRSTSHLLKFVSEHLDFDTTPEFSLLGQLVAVLALHIADSVKEIGQIAAEAMYHLHYIIMSRMAKEIEKKHKNKKGNVVKWLREDFFVPGPAVFYNNIAKVAQAFGEHLNSNQITDVVLKAIQNLTHEDKSVSQAAGILLSSFLEECGMDMEDLPMIIKEIYNRLPEISDPITKEETLKAVCSLASKRLNGVVDILLECSVECDENVAEIWKALVADPYANMKLMRPLLKRLQDEDPLSDVSYRRHSKSIMPLAATNALCLILSLPEASDALQNKFSHLLLALVTQIYFVLGAGRRGSKRSSLTDAPIRPNALSTTIQALKNLIACAGYIKEYSILGMQGCWDMLSAPDTYFDGLFLLARTLFTFTKVHLKMTFKQANAYLRHADVKERTVGMAFFTELLYHPEIGIFFMKQDILDVLREWMAQTCPLMRVFSIRGLGHLLQHPLEDETLEPLLPPLINCAFDPDRNIAKESIKTLQYMFQHLDVEEFGSAAIGLLPLLLKYLSDDDPELRRASIVLFGMLLKGVKENQRNSVTENVFKSLVPLLIQLVDHSTKEVARGCLCSCANFLNWTDMPHDIFDYELHDRISTTYLNICIYIMRRYKPMLPGMLAQMVEFLKSRNPSYREAAALLIACNAQYMKPDVVSTPDVETVFLALRELQGDCDASVTNAAVLSIEEVYRHCGYRINPQLVPNQLMIMLRNSMSKPPFEARH
ncbi:maestro heat-like repeat family member 5 [Sceloporus undulatus]|uniref:maestro heat-like repeat family member 5 n=1 Tax=Sceloporus undulatus TaxID=8520 RepID=UPI001C4C47BB|nr:maestro heat-like repeat family member 5 [Sceloporus undulatus]